MSQTWNAADYDRGHSYVWTLAADLIEVLDPRPGERIVDLGSGTGHLTAQIAAKGAHVVGMDSSAEMVARARENYPQIEFVVGNAADFQLDQRVDAVFSNATLHWVKDLQAAANSMARALRGGGRLVVEFGGAGNVRTIMQAIAAGLKAVGAPAFEALSPWHYPSIAEYAGILDRAGVEVTFAQLFDRPTLIEAGLQSWLELYGTRFLQAVGETKREAFLRTVEEYARPALFKEGKWVADYRRLRVVGRKVR